MDNYRIQLLRSIAHGGGVDGQTPLAEALASLSRERDPQLFYESLLNLGMRLENRGQFQEAASVYGAIISHPVESIGVSEYRSIGESFHVSNSPTHRHSVTPILVQRAKERLDVIHGLGASGPRLESFARNLGRQVIDPTMIAGLAVGGIVSSVLRGGHWRDCWPLPRRVFSLAVGVPRSQPPVWPLLARSLRCGQRPMQQTIYFIPMNPASM
jgi:hypothetical protein